MPMTPRFCYHAESAHGGNQFAELNCGLRRFYQDVLTVPGATLLLVAVPPGPHRGGQHGAADCACCGGGCHYAGVFFPAAQAAMVAALNRTVTVDGESHTISEYIVK